MNIITKDDLKSKIFELVRDYHSFAHSQRDFVPGETKVPYAGRVFDSDELVTGVDSMLDFWLTSGPYANQLETKMKEYFDASQCLLVNSGSSANLLMLATLCSRNVKNRLKPGDEVITPAATFPTTLTPIVQHNLVPCLSTVYPDSMIWTLTKLRLPLVQKPVRFLHLIRWVFLVIWTSSWTWPSDTTSLF